MRPAIHPSCQKSTYDWANGAVNSVDRSVNAAIIILFLLDFPQQTKKEPRQSIFSTGFMKKKEFDPRYNEKTVLSQMDASQTT